MLPSSNRPIVSHAFSPVSGGKLEWQFEFDWQPVEDEETFAVLMQLGEGALMSTGDPQAGVGVSLGWTNLPGSELSLAYWDGTSWVALQSLSGPATISVLADLESRSYAVSIDGVPVGKDISFANAVSLDTVRFLASELDETNFHPRCFDNLEIAVPDPGETQGLAGDVLTALAGVWSSAKHAWQWLGEQAAALRRELSPQVAYAATTEDPVFRFYYFHNGSRVSMRVEGDPDPNNNGVFFFLHDQLGSTTVTLKRGGTGALTKVGELRYTPWGSNRDSGYASSDTPTDYRFTDQREENSFGLYHFNARWFDPVFGRFNQPDTLIPNPNGPLDWDRYTGLRNNPVNNIDPSGHRTCSVKQAATGDETCDQNYKANDLINSLENLYGWQVQGEWMVKDLVELIIVAKTIREYIYENTGKDGNLWIKTYLGNAVFYYGNDTRSFVYPLADVYLRKGEEQFWKIHELGHVLDNNMKSGVGPATFFGGGAADAMLSFVGGNPENCFPRFQCNQGYINNVAGNDPWPEGEYGNNSVADDLAQTFANVIVGGNVPLLRSTWMQAFLGVLANQLP